MFKQFCLFCLLPIYLFFPLSWSQAAESVSIEKLNQGPPIFDLRNKDWLSDKSYNLDGYWNTYWSTFIPPEKINTTSLKSIKFPVPGVWNKNPYRFVENQRVDSMKGAKAQAQQVIFPSLGYATYHAKVLIPADQSPLYLYLPDMPSAYKLFINGQLRAQNGEPGFYQSTEQPQFRPKVLKLDQHQGELDIVIHLSNYHYREGGIWFSLRLTGEAGRFNMEYQPLIFAVFFSAILIAIGLYNFSLFAFRSTEIGALYFGLLCLVVGFRRLIIDERVLHLFDWFSWATLQRLEHLCFYLTLPLFMGFFSALYHRYVPASTMRISWLLISPFMLICLAFENRIYTELNIAFQVLVLISVSYVVFMYFRAVQARGKNLKAFGASLLVLAITVIHDVLKANGMVGTPVNIAHFGVLAFVISQSIALQRRYLKNLDLVEAMSEQLRFRNEELLKMDTFKDEFLATTSHELRTPLQGISGLANVLAESDTGSLSADQKNKIELISNTSQRLGVLVNDILDFSSIKHGKLKLNRSPVDLNAISELVLATMRPLLRNKNVSLSAEISPSARYLQADEFRIQQILINIMGNAVKYTEKGFIRLSAYQLGNQVILKISDSGVGMPAEKRQSLFRPFEQIHVKGHPSASGTGLGLSISRQLVELHGGTLELNSQVGKGTEVIISFGDDILSNKEACAINHSKPSTAEEPTSPINKPMVTKLKNASEPKDSNQDPLIFIVDDEPVNLELVSSLISQQGYRYEVFPDGLSVLARLNSQLPDLLLLDYMMPRMSGIEVCQLIRKQYDSYELPIMMLTARHQISDIVSALSNGANDYLIKPYHNKELIARVKSQLSVRKFWIANQENQKLRNEIIKREALEEELSELNSKLLSVLDISEELIIVVNEQLNIAYTNDKAIQVFNKGKQESSPKTSLLGLSISDFILPELLEQLKRMLKEKATEPYTVDLPDEQTGHHLWHTSIKYVNDSEQPYLALVISQRAIDQSKTKTEDASALAHLSKELIENRRKINEIEGALKHVMSPPDDSKSNPLLTDTENQAGLPKPDTEALLSVSTPDKPVALTEQKELIVSLLRSSLNLWERATNKSKVDLAEQSRCWRVYVDGTTVKTRTFDKYLSARTVPDRPRWRAVVRTANYVLANCDIDASDKQELEALTRQVEDLYT